MTNVERIVELRREIRRLRKGEAPRMASLRERLVLMIVNALLLIAMAKLGVVTAETEAQTQLEKQETTISRDAWRAETAEVITQALVEGCTFDEQ